MSVILATKPKSAQVIINRGGASGPQGPQGPIGPQGPVANLSSLATGVIAGTYGGTSNVAVITVMSNGLLLFAGNTEVSGVNNFAASGNSFSITTSTGAVFTANIQENSVRLGTDTTGNYVQNLLAGTNITITNDTGEGNTPTISLNDSINISGNMSVGGNLYVSGGATYLNTTTAVVEDALIKLGNANPADIVDIGFYGQYQNGTNKYAGLFRDATDNKFKVFTGLEADPEEPNLVNIPSAGYTRGILVTDIQDGIVSELVQPIAVEDGGTGLSSLVQNGILFANGLYSINFVTGTYGAVLQINSSGIPVLDILDGGEY